MFMNLRRFKQKSSGLIDSLKLVDARVERWYISHLSNLSWAMLSIPGVISSRPSFHESVYRDAAEK